MTLSGSDRWFWIQRIQQMHGTVTEDKKQRTPTGEKVALGIVGLLGFFGAVFLDRNGLPQKWQAAIYGTIPPFALVIVSYRLGWRRWSFWASLGICVAIHTMAIFLYFQAGFDLESRLSASPKSQIEIPASFIKRRTRQARHTFAHLARSACL
jgi:hypothetical protein